AVAGAEIDDVVAGPDVRDVEHQRDVLLDRRDEWRDGLVARRRRRKKRKRTRTRGTLPQATPPPCHPTPIRSTLRGIGEEYRSRAAPRHPAAAPQGRSGCPAAIFKGRAAVRPRE